jgi:pyruvate, orthophosphate dikinase
MSSDPFRIYRFGSINEGSLALKDVIGGKAAGIAEMQNLGVPISPGYTFPTSMSIDYLAEEVDEVELLKLIAQGDEYLLDTMGYLPLVSVRSGARVSMPGMMDTILNIGLTRAAMPEWEARIGRWATLDSRRRLLQMFGSVAMGISAERFEKVLSAQRKSAQVANDSELSEDHLSRVIEKYEDIIASSGLEFPDTREEQIIGAVMAVFDSWNNQRAKDYRSVNKIPFEWGTSATVQAMVFGNVDDRSCSGVAFSRNFATGEPDMIVDWLPKSQGEEVVAGIRDPLKRDAMFEWDAIVASQLFDVAGMLEQHYRDMVDIEFTVQSGKLYVLQVRVGKRSARAAFKIAFDMVADNLISKEEAVSRVGTSTLFSALVSTVDPAFKKAPNLTGIACGGGVVQGVAVFTAADAVNCTSPCVLIREETDPDDFAGMAAAVGLLTSRGGETCHAAVVARSMSKSCVVGAAELEIVGNHAKCPGGVFVSSGDLVTVDGSTGRVWFGAKVPIISGEPTPEILAVCSWAASEEIAQRLELSGAMSVAQVKAAVGSIMTSTVYVDVAALEFRGQPGSPKAIELLQALGQALDESEVDSVIVDLTPLADHLSHADKVFMSMLGESPVSNAWAIATIKLWPASLIAKCFVKGADVAGFRKFTTVKTFADLLTADGPIDVQDSDIVGSFGSRSALHTAMGLVAENRGVNFMTARPAYWYGFIEE